MTGLAIRPLIADFTKHAHAAAGGAAQAQARLLLGLDHRQSRPMTRPATFSPTPRACSGPGGVFLVGVDLKKDPVDPDPGL